MAVTPIDYVLLLERNYPTALFGGSCETYAKIAWKDTVISQPSQTQLDAEWVILEVQLAMESKIKELSVLARLDVIAGFWSSALGTAHFYDSAEIDQVNLIGMVTQLRETFEKAKTAAKLASQPEPAEPSDYFSARILSTDIQKAYYPHTLSQLSSVMDDGKIFKMQVLQTFNNLKDQVLAKTSVVDVNAVVWTSMKQV